ncbi:MAG: leucine-rich repeat domain-containing protein [Treponema sp.]|nr:leucine-rich repeat domain-containing protein [Treponema sp.]
MKRTYGVFFLAVLFGVISGSLAAQTNTEWRDHLSSRAEAQYTHGDIRAALWYYRNLAYYYPEYYKGWIGIIRCYSDDYENFDFTDSELYMERARKAGPGQPEVQQIGRLFDAAWPDVQARREQRKIAEAKRREDNFHNMTFVSKNGVLELYNGSAEEVFIPEDITVIGDAAFRQNGRIKRVVLHNKITAIGNNAFAKCSALTDITIPASVTSFGSGVFGDCFSLSSITVPGNITSVPDNTFAGCKNLVDVTIGDGVKAIGKAFTGCENLTGIIIPKTVESIAEFAFSQCKNLKNVTVVNEKAKIGRRAFLACPVENKDELTAKFGAEIFR